MKFAAGLTVSGVISLLLLELLKLVAPALQGFVLGLLGIAVKAILVLLVLLVAATVLGVGFFFYNRGKKAGAEV